MAVRVALVVLAVALEVVNVAVMVVVLVVVLKADYRNLCVKTPLIYILGEF